MNAGSEVLFLGGRSGVGKSSVAFELHTQLAALNIKHCVIEGDNLDLAFPHPWEHHLAEKYLAAIWANYRALGYRRMIYTNTVSVRFTEELAAAMGDGPKVTAVLLTATDETASARLRIREQGSDLQAHLERSNDAAGELERLTPDWVHRRPTDNRSVQDIAAGILPLTGWITDGAG
ncbi:adenylyl-sulfate kinase [Arthrobacter sp. CDRTa11]|uniref:adenylyl-sulfate kinase n=1 Tax=Arthrobacter sp. CDRTa11 TaxID=2651199 RepID=UPI00226593DD|nr:adenylyl-sulfate kinase [Arthrobacter sp. CDRTa11]UZX04779.1 adenylyl-sulfate kinase [Arthrobacter sp. CDRTa11]